MISLTLKINKCFKQISKYFYGFGWTYFLVGSHIVTQKNDSCVHVDKKEEEEKGGVYIQFYIINSKQFLRWCLPFRTHPCSHYRSVSWHLASLYGTCQCLLG